jgi:hypothetical protein
MQEAHEGLPHNLACGETPFKEDGGNMSEDSAEASQPGRPEALQIRESELAAFAAHQGPETHNADGSIGLLDL